MDSINGRGCRLTIEIVGARPLFLMFHYAKINNVISKRIITQGAVKKILQIFFYQCKMVLNVSHSINEENIKWKKTIKNYENLFLGMWYG